MIPNAATDPALIFVGFLMISGFKDIDFADFTESRATVCHDYVHCVYRLYRQRYSAGILAFVSSNSNR